MTRILQISDTHLSPLKRHFGGNWQPLCDWIALQDADIIVHTGDVTVNGADSDEDMQYCRELLQPLKPEVLVLPGNHDVGEPKHPYQPVNPERLDRWRRYFGPDHWFRDVGDWRLIGLNAMLLGSGEAAESEQLAWLDETLETADHRHIAWFMHRPLFIDRPDDGDLGYWAPPPQVRAELLERLDRHNVTLVASGHLHRYYDLSMSGVRFIWGPSSGFLVGPELQRPMPGAARLGAIVYDLCDSRMAVAFADVPGLTDFRIEDVVHEVYPPHGS
jgi:3',5'-cyclic AMP phosphodiesterase CpdA